MIRLSKFFLTSAAIGAALAASAEAVHISTPGTSLVVEATEGQPLKFMYYGDRLTDTDLSLIHISEPTRP